MAPASRDANDDDTMVSLATLDLLLLTYNCAKAPIDVAGLAAHLQGALLSGSSVDVGVGVGAALPNLVVFALQEVAPLGHAFAGSYFLDPYLARFDDALALAAAAATDETEVEAGSASASDDDAAGLNDASTPLTGTKAHRTPRHYHRIRQAHVGMTAILLFARDPSACHDVEVAFCGFGVADMGNKGAVGLRIAYGQDQEGMRADDSSRSVLTFVATHLAPMEWNVRRRNANWRSIVAGLTFGDPRAVMTDGDAAGVAAPGRRHDQAACAPPTPAEEAETEAAEAAGDAAWLLLGQQKQKQKQKQRTQTQTQTQTQAQAQNDGQNEDQPPPAVDVRRRLQDLSVFRPDSLLFVAGDLNYRIDDHGPPPDAVFPTAHSWPAFLARDQLTAERRAGRTFHGLHEAPVRFPPTYKHDVLAAADLAAGAVPDNADEIAQWKQEHEPDTDARPPVPWKYARHRWPSWCDRVLYLDVPVWAKQRWAAARGRDQDADGGPGVRVMAYQSLPLMPSSDHQPVYLRATVPLLGAAARPPADALDEDADADAGNAANEPIDPRLRLPVAIDVDAWARRARARHRERIAGGGMLLFNTRTGALVMATAVVVVVGLYWLRAGFV